MKIFRSIQPKSVTHANATSDRPRKITVPLFRQGMKSALGASLRGRLQYDVQRVRLWRPNAKVRFVFADNLRTYRITPLHSGVFSSGHHAMVVFDLASPVKLVRPK